VDDEGHVRLIDMGLASRFSETQPTRTSRVGTDCYMAPEVRWARKRRAPYGVSCDWYTVGVLLYEFANGALPYSQRETDAPQVMPTLTLTLTLTLTETLTLTPTLTLLAAVPAGRLPLARVPAALRGAPQPGL